jgi:7-carboxy-7-deazaguanine synthase
MQRDLRDLTNNGFQYPINEIFHSIQGEGHFTGTPATFIRLQGCDVGCSWCDTKHSWEFDKGRRGLMSVLKLLEQVPKAVRHVVITGGEPCAFDLVPLTTALLATDRVVQIETSGTYVPHVHRDAWLTVSPKVGMKREVVPEALRRADEIKMPIGKPRDLDNLAMLLPRVNTKLVSLQPLSLSKTATRLCVETALAKGYRVSPQVHRLIEVE